MLVSGTEEVRVNYSFCSFRDAEIYITGGSIRGKISNTVFVFDLKTKRIKEAPSMQKARHCHSSVATNKSLYVCGGLEVPGNTEKGCSIEKLDLPYRGIVKDSSWTVIYD